MPELAGFCRRSVQPVVAITLPAYAAELFQLTDRNRAFLGQWLPWLDTIGRPEDTLRFIHEQDRRRLRGEALHCSIFCQGQIAGVVEERARLLYRLAAPSYSPSSAAS